MGARLKLWFTAIAFYAAFTLWYTDFGGPLSDKEIDQFVATMTANGAAPEVAAFIEKFAREDTGRQFLMVNNINFNENPPLVEGAEPGEAAEKLMARYLEHMIPALLSRASHPLVMGTVIYPAIDIVGIEGAEKWDQGALFRYRSRRSFMEIVTNPAFKGKHHFKTAALEKTIAYPMEATLNLGDPRLLIGLLMLAVASLLDSIWISRRV